MTEHDREEKFLRRWSRRKIDDDPTDEVVQETGLSEDGLAAVPDGDDEPEEVDAEFVANLPDIETLEKDSDYTGFLRDGVPEELKRLALRKLWLSDPILANLDGLNDYDEDFGAILKSGAKYMQRLADAGEKFTRPGAAEDELSEDAETEDVETEDLVAENEAPDPELESDVAEIQSPDTSKPSPS